MPTATVSLASPAPRAALRLGFLPCTDAAPLLVAERRGLFAQHGLQVQLQREIGWATLREKVIYGELDAVHAPSALLWSTRAGLDCAPCDVVTGLVTSIGGHALTLARALWDIGVRDTASLVPYVRNRRRPRPLTLGASSLFSTSHLVLLGWLEHAGLHLTREVRIIVVPPTQMVRQLAAGTIDGFCAGEPWNRLAIREGTGWSPVLVSPPSTLLADKVLMATARFAKTRSRDHCALIAALIEACLWCDEPQNREPLAELLAEDRYLNVPSKDLTPDLLGRSATGQPDAPTAPDAIHFARDEANVPSAAKAQALQAALVAAGVIPASAVDTDTPRRLFREDLYREALSSLPTDAQSR